MNRAAFALALAALAGCHERVQLLDGETTIPEDCLQCASYGVCEAAEDGTACSVGVCRSGACETDPAGKAIAMVAAGENNTCAITDAKELFCWGDNSRGQVGVGNTEPQPLPVLVESGPWDSVAVGQYHVCGIRSGGSLWCWGGNARGQLGILESGDRARPQEVTSAVGQWSQVSAGAKHTCALTADAELYCWGRGTEGQLGSGDVVDAREPVVVATSGFTPRSLSLGRDHTCVVDSRSGLWCWGENTNGQLGQGDELQRDTPTRVALDVDASALSAAGSHTCALSSASEAHCFGRNSDGQLGLEDTSGHYTTPQPLDYDLAFDVLEVGSRHSCGLGQGALWCWGNGAEGQLGDGDLARNRSPRKVEVAEDWRAVTAGHSHTCGLRSDGTLWCWGSNEVGQLGLPSATALAFPTLVSLPE